MFQAAYKKKKTNLTGAKGRQLTFPRVMHSETSQVEKLYFIILNKKERKKKLAAKVACQNIL